MAEQDKTERHQHQELTAAISLSLVEALVTKALEKQTTVISILHRIGLPDDMTRIILEMAI